MNSNKITKLKRLYSVVSKHSNYQILPNMLAELISNDEIEVKSRFEGERINYILNNLTINNKVILDIGGNSGFFTFGMLENGARKVHYYEGNNAHSEFVKLSAEILNISDRVKISNSYFPFGEFNGEKYNIILLLNVLHHIGDDYGNKKLSIEEAKNVIIDHLNLLAEMAEIIVFQLGFNWKGNRTLPFFENGTKEEMINYIIDGTMTYWKIVKIGIAQQRFGKIEYLDLDEENIKRFDNLGEFLNRPIFILRSLR